MSSSNPIQPLPLEREDLPCGITLYPVLASEEGVWSYVVGVDRKRGTVHCDCYDFRCTLHGKAEKLDMEPSVWTPQFQCKHVRWLCSLLKREGRIDYYEED